MRPGQLLQAVLVLAVGKGGVEDVDDIELRDAGGHRPAAEGGLIGRGVELVIRQLRNRGGDAAGDGDDGGAVLPHGLQIYLTR